MIERLAQALEIESWHLFKNEPVIPSSSNQYSKLAPTQKKEIATRANAALMKILEQF